MPSLRHLAAAPVAALAAVLAVTGCANLPTTAAVVNGQTFTEGQVNEVAAAIPKLDPTVDVASARSIVLSNFIDAAVAEQIAAEQNIPITDQARAAALATTGADTSEPALQPFFKAWATTNIVVAKIGNPAFVAALGRVPVTVNPRLGVFDKTQGAIVATNGSFSSPFVPPSAAPAAPSATPSS